ncbi:hypothetical protein BGI37_11585 [Snodgrassella alvi]|nr:hypothetical protein BGI37_11585 [Snodgrassella alvi]
MVEFGNFEICWENDQFKAKGLVANIREVVHKKDSFTRMKQERDTERNERLAKQSAERNASIEKRIRLDDIKNRLSALFTIDDKPHQRGKLYWSLC